MSNLVDISVVLLFSEGIWRSNWSGGKGMLAGRLGGEEKRKAAVGMYCMVKKNK